MTVFELTAAAWCPGPERGTKPISATTRCLGTEAKSYSNPGPPSVASERSRLRELRV